MLSLVIQIYMLTDGGEKNVEAEPDFLHYGVDVAVQARRGAA